MKLGERDLEILSRLHLRNVEIAETFSISTRTVEKVVEKLLIYYGVSTRTGAMLCAISEGDIPNPFVKQGKRK